MRLETRITRKLLFSFAVIFTSTANAHAQSSPDTDRAARPELALTYTYVRSNAPPASCTCFSLNGGSATFAWPLHRIPFDLVGDVTVAHGGNIVVGNFALSLSTYTAGARYLPHLGDRRIQPYGQVLLGVGHADGSLVQGQQAAVGNAGAAFSADLGAGVDLRSNRRVSIRLIEADWLHTTFDNGSNNLQNNLRLSTGLIVRF